MIGRSGLFADIMCPYDEDCTRPHCHFWHSKDDISQQQQQYPVALMSTTVPEQPFVGYVGYVESQKTAIETTVPICNQSIYAPLDPVVYTQPPSTSGVQHSSVTYIPTKITPRPICKRMPSPEISKPKMPVELSVDDILDPANDKSRISVAPSVNGSNLIENTKLSEMSLNDYAKSVADIDTRIEELQRKIEIERQQKEKIVHDIRALVKPPASVNSDSLAARKHSGSKSKSKLTYTGGYTPTPIALLKSVEKAKIEAEQKKKSGIEENDNEKDVANLKNKAKGGKIKDKSKNVKVKKVENVEGSKRQSTKGKSQSVAKKKLNEQLSIEDLFETDVPAAKKRKHIGDDLKSKASSLPEKVEKQKEMQINMEEAKRIAHSSMQSTAQICLTATKVRAPTMAQQLMNRYQKLQKEKEELLRNMKLKKEIKAKKIITAEEKHDYKSGAVAATVGKGEKRMAHTPKVSKSTKINLIPLDPYSCGKVPYALRARYLNLFYIECQKFCGSTNDAVTQAQHEEKAIKDRAVTKGGYTSAAVNVLRRLRDVNSPQVAVLKSVSHSAILAGRHYGSITVGQKKYSAPGKQFVNESEFYALLLSKFVLDEQKLEQNGFPLWEDLKRICCRCGTEFSLTPKGEYTALKQCVYHWGKAFKTKTRGLWESRYNCCQSDLNVAGCCVADCHVTDTAPKSVLETYRETQKRFFELVNSETILIGHSLESDLKAMRLVHHRVVDTSVVFPHRLGLPYKRALKTIASEILQLIIQEDTSETLISVDGHDSKEDASTCMRLMLHKVVHN
ncbi:unnamed protein product [Wuchereria bancrofti]|uniref:RNA exonuclease 1 homolog-like domain-containing protein n=1 Tax=Wuchereria bancrofti TaxID=6293 RepID=A0A3P7DN25_WUCBA|nr:unnamed protein product [Wuchereria bancrofti]